MEKQTLDHFTKLFNELKNSQVMREDLLDQELQKLEGGDEVDIATNNRDRDLLLKLKGRQNFFLKKVDGALNRITEGSFGECFDCGDDIAADRLYARPTATHCIACKEAQERGESHLLYEKKSHTRGQGIDNSAIKEIPIENNEINGEKVLKFNREKINLGIQNQIS
jgi:DnaK suppressor protein